MKLKQNKQSKLVIALSAVILLLVALSATLTFAYFTAQSTASDADIKFGNLTLTEGNGGTSFGVVQDTIFQPGDTIIVKGKTVLSSNIDAYYRVKMDVAIYTTYTSASATNNVLVTCANKTDDSSHACNDTCDLGKQLKLIKDTFFKKMKADGTVSQTDSENTKGLQISLTDLAEYNGYYYGLKTKNGNSYSDITIFDYTNVSDSEDKGVTITLDATKFGNWWQDKIVVITVQVDAIQALHLQKTTDGTVTNLTEGTAKQIGTSNGQISVVDLASADAWNTIANDGVKSN